MTLNPSKQLHALSQHSFDDSGFEFGISINAYTTDDKDIREAELSPEVCYEMARLLVEHGRYLENKKYHPEPSEMLAEALASEEYSLAETLVNKIGTDRDDS